MRRSARLSVQHAFPKVYNLEQRYGFAHPRPDPRAPANANARRSVEGPCEEILVRRGIAGVADTLHRHLGSAVRLRATVTGLTQTAPAGRYGSPTTPARSRRITWPCFMSAPPTGCRSSPSRPPCRCRWRVWRIDYPPVASVVLGFRRADVRPSVLRLWHVDPAGRRFPDPGHHLLLGAVPGRAPEGHLTLTSYLGGAQNPEVARLDDSRLVDLTLGDLRTLLGLPAGPRSGTWSTGPGPSRNTRWATDTTSNS